MATYFVGMRAVVTAEFTRVSDGTPVNPAEVFAKTEDPQALIKTYEFGVDSQLTNPSTGQFQIEFPLTKAGEWKVRIEGRTTNEAAFDQSILVRESPFYNPDGSEVPDTP